MDTYHERMEKFSKARKLKNLQNKPKSEVNEIVKCDVVIPDILESDVKCSATEECSATLNEVKAICVQCKTLKDSIGFSRHKKKKNGLNSVCKECRASNIKTKRKANDEIRSY